LSNQAEATGAERGPHCQLSPPRCATREHEVRDIATCEQQDQKDRSGQNHQGPLRVPQQIVSERTDNDPEVALIVFVWISLHERAEDCVHLRGRRRGGCTWTQTRKALHVVPAAPVARRRRIQRQRHIEIRSRARGNVMLRGESRVSFHPACVTACALGVGSWQLAVVVLLSLSRSCSATDTVTRHGVREEGKACPSITPFASSKRPTRHSV
jgi:hypothetical protein